MAGQAETARVLRVDGELSHIDIVTAGVAVAKAAKGAPGDMDLSIPTRWLLGRLIALGEPVAGTQPLAGVALVGNVAREGLRSMDREQS